MHSDSQKLHSEARAAQLLAAGDLRFSAAAPPRIAVLTTSSTAIGYVENYPSNL